MNCDLLRANLRLWEANQLDELSARALEAHAAACPACEQRLEAASHLPAIPHTVMPPPALRDATLARVVRVQRVSGWQRTALAMTGIAAVAVMAIMVRPHQKSATDFRGAGSYLLASKLAQPEFRQLDAAEKDLVEALATHPTDVDLTEGLRRIQRQRETLRSLVTRAPE